MIDIDENINSLNSISIKLKSFLDKIALEKTYEEGKKELIEHFKCSISNEKFISLSLKYINNIIIQKENIHNKILSFIPLILQINPKIFLNHVDIILSVFQNIISKKEENTKFYSQISQYFCETAKILLNNIDTINYNNIEKNINNHLLAQTYNKFKMFCISNINSNNINCQICGILCLTSFIENCSFNYINKENMKNIFDILSEKIKQEKFPAKLEILNCFISLIFCSEEKYLPYAKDTLNIVIKFIDNKEWLMKKFSLNIIYTMLIYYQNEMMEKRELIVENLKILQNEKNKEIKDMMEQIYLLLNEEEDFKFNTNKNEYSADSKNNNNKIHDNDNYPINNDEFNLNSDDREDINENYIKSSREPRRIIKKYKNNLINNPSRAINNRNEAKKIKSKSKSNYKRNIKQADNINNIKMNKTLKQKNENKKIMDNVKIIIKNIKNKKNVEKSRNSLDKYFTKKKKQPISMSIKRNNDISLKKTIIKNNNDKNYGFNSPEKNKKILNINKNKSNKSNNHINENNIRKSINNTTNTKQTINIKKNKISSLNKTQDNKKIFEGKKLTNKIISNLKGNKLRNNNSFEFKNNKSFGKHGFLKIKKEKQPEKKNNKKSNNDIKNNYNSDINKYIKNNNSEYNQLKNKYIKNLNSDFSKSENHSFLNNNPINNNSNNNNIISASNKSNNNITINNNVISISDKNNLNNDFSSSSIENKFIEYKNETSKIINELKSQVNQLKISLNNYEEIEKNKKNLIVLVKNKNFEKAFETAINIGNIQEINYVIKNYLLNEKGGINLSKKVLSNIISILCKDILLCENLQLITNFIIKNICEKNIFFDEELNKVIYDVFLELYNKRKELCLLNKGVNNILKIINFFKNKF